MPALVLPLMLALMPSIQKIAEKNAGWFVETISFKFG